MIERVTYARLYALPDNKYENERFEVTAIVQDGDVDAAFDEARRQVEAQYARFAAERRPQRPAEPFVTARQANYIARLQDNLGWSNEQMAAYAGEQGVDLAAMTMFQAGTLIDGMKRLSEERSETTRPPPLADGYLPF